MGGVLLYDGECRICTTLAGWLQRRTDGSASVVAWQHADLPRLGVTPADCTAGVLWVGSDHENASGMAATAAYLRTSSRPSWQMVGRALSTRLGGALLEPVHRFLERHRRRLPGGTPSAELPRIAVPVKGVRRRKPRDLAACARLLRVVFHADSYPYNWPDAPRAWLDDPEVLDAWVAERLGQLLGHVAISQVGTGGISPARWREITAHEPSELAAVSRLFVRPRNRGEGIGSALLEVATAEIRARGLLPVLEVVSVNEDAIQLYADRGWRLLAMDPWGPNTDRLRVFCYAAPNEPIRSSPHHKNAPSR